MILKKIFLLIGLLVLFQIAGVVASLTNITNCTDLQAMDDNLTNDYQLMNNIDCSDTINWNSGAGFNQIGDDSTSCFRGNFSGNGYNITDLYINRTDDNYIALFACTNGVVVSNLGLVNVNISGGVTGVGGLIGYIAGTTNINHSFVTGNIYGANDYKQAIASLKSK